MADINTIDVINSSVGFMSALVSSLFGALMMFGGFLFKDQNKRLKDLENQNKEIIRGFSEMATKQDIKNTNDKIDKLYNQNTDRIIELIKDLNAQRRADFSRVD